MNRPVEATAAISEVPMSTECRAAASRSLPLRIGKMGPASDASRAQPAGRAARGRSGSECFPASDGAMASIVADAGCRVPSRPRFLYRRSYVSIRLCGRRMWTGCTIVLPPRALN